MKTFFWEWKSFDGLTMFAQGWVPDGEPKAVVALHHGHGEHIGRYAHVGAVFAAAGYALLGYDLRGHGKSGGARGSSPSVDAYFKDMEGFLGEVKVRYPSTPRFGYGHSLGGLFLLAHCLYQPIDLKGMIISSPALETAVQQQKLKLLLVQTLGSLAPTLTLPTDLVPAHISRDPQVVTAYINDPLVHNKISAGLGRASLDAIAIAYQGAAKLSLPVLLVYCSDDKIAFPSGSEKFASLAPKSMLTVKRYEGLYHEPHNELEKAQVLGDYIQWLDAQMKSG